MRTPIWLRILLVIDLVVAGAAVAVGLLASEIAGKVVEERLLKQTAERTGEFVRSRNLPFTDTLMGYLREMHGVHFITVRTRDGAVVSSSLPVERRGELSAKTGSLGTAGAVALGDGRYRYESHELYARPEAEGAADEPLTLYALVPEGEFRDARDLAAGRITRVTVIVLIATSALAIVLSLTIARPIRRLADRMESLAGRAGEGEAVEAATPRRGPREVAQLAESFDRLMARLWEARAAVARHERLAAVGTVAAGVVHELRNPLSGIRMNLRVLRDELEARGIADESLAAGLREIERMQVVLDELTDLASGEPPGERGPLSLGALQPVRLDELVEESLAVFAGRCRHAGVEVVRRYEARGTTVPGDAGRLKQVLINLIVNALDAMSSGGTLEIRVEPGDGGRARVTVADTGGGVRGVDAEGLFEPFVTSKTRSAGLGLYVCKRIIEAHGGEIGWRNTDGGAEFRFELPAGVPEKAPSEEA